MIDLPVITRSQAALLSSGSTFDDFSLLVIDRIIKRAESSSAQRTDIVTDQYTKLLIKPARRLTGESKSFGQQIFFDSESQVPNYVRQSLLTDEMNKTKLNEFIIWEFVSCNSWKH